jgi:diguanylate cyclase (GGDEF)-like protein
MSPLPNSRNYTVTTLFNDKVFAKYGEVTVGTAMSNKQQRNNGTADWLLRHQLDAYFEKVPASLAGNLVNAGVVAALFYSKVAWWVLIAYGVATIALAAFRYRSIARYRESAAIDAGLSQWVAHVTRQIAALGLLWGTTICGLIAIATAEETAFLGMVAAGMTSAGALSFASLPYAVRNYVALVAVPTFVALIWVGTPLAFTSAALVASFSFVLIRAAVVNYANFVVRHTRERELRESAETVKLLLHDYQEHGSDWLWEVDADGRLVAPSLRFAQAAERPLETIAGMVMLDLFDGCPEREILADNLQAARSFRDIAVPLMIGGERRWWSMSGHPVSGDGGVMRLRGVATDISATKNAEVQVAYMAHYDGLTDLPNRFLFNDTLNRALNRQKSGTGTAVLSLDLDHFKSVNDTLGHPAGDALLKIVSRRIESCLKERDIVARMGGDEFAILLTGVRNRADVETVAARILKALASPIEIDSAQVLTAASIGVAIAPDDGSDADVLMKHVDLALYSAKADGRNRMAFFETGMDEAAQARRTVEIDLRSAMCNDELSLHYQPLINVVSGETVAYEALLRWHHPTRGLVMPNDFVPIAEETGLIVQLGEWVIRNAVDEVGRWPDHIGVSVNLSPLQMKSASLISTIINALAASNVAPARLELEITESVLMHESEVNIATLHRLRAIGVRIALDDFGTGYSSLNYLRSFPFDKIKIDRCFVQDVDSREDCQAIVRAVTGLATSLGMVTTAEGVETSEQLAELRAQGCTEVQGFLFSKAVPVGELTDLRAPAIGKSRGLPALAFLPAIDLAPAAAKPEPRKRKRQA